MQREALVQLLIKAVIAGTGFEWNERGLTPPSVRLNNPGLLTADPSLEVTREGFVVGPFGLIEYPTPEVGLRELARLCRSRINEGASLYQFFNRFPVRHRWSALGTVESQKVGRSYVSRHVPSRYGMFWALDAARRVFKQAGEAIGDHAPLMRLVPERGRSFVHGRERGVNSVARRGA